MDSRRMTHCVHYTPKTKATQNQQALKMIRNRNIPPFNVRTMTLSFTIHVLILLLFHVIILIPPSNAQSHHLHQHHRHSHYSSLFSLSHVDYDSSFNNIDTHISSRHRNLNNGNTRIKHSSRNDTRSGKFDDSEDKGDDIVFGGLFPIHNRGLQGSHTCGSIKRERGIQRLEAMLYAIDLINKDPKLLTGLKIGLNVHDTCTDDTYALEQCMGFIKAQMQLSSFNVTQESRCSDGTLLTHHTLQPVAGVIGAASSPVSIMVANILRLFKIPQISYASTSADLSDKSRYDYFTRVVPSDAYQAQAMADIAQSLGWTFVNTLADAGTYGEKGIQAFIELTKNSGVCVSRSESIPHGVSDEKLLTIVQNLFRPENTAHAILMFVNEDNSKKVIKALKKLNMSDQVSLLASDSWGAKEHLVKGQEAAAEGTVTILPKRSVIPGFDEYFLNLTLNNTRNRWFKEFWADVFNCSVGKFGLHKKKCTGRESLRDLADYKQEGLVQFVIDSVFALAHAVHDILSARCPGDFKGCDALGKLNGPEFLEYIRNTSFYGISGDLVKFNKDGDSLGRYDIYQFQRLPLTNKFAYVKVGEWVDQLNLSTSALRWKNASSSFPVSKCSEPCGFGEKKMTKNSACCWMCIPCKENEYMPDETTCKPCPENHRPNATLTGCESLPIIFLVPASLWFILPVAFSLAGVLCTIFVFGVFIAFNKTPIIMASGRELCYILLLGIALSYFTSMVMLARPTALSCAIQRLGLGVSLCFVYAAILTKTNRIFRIFSVGIKAMVKRPSYTSPKSQILICAAMVSVQIVGGFTWLGFEKPDVKLVLYQKNTLVLKCRASQIATLVSLFYNIFLIILCTVYAFKTRKIPQNFNEAKYIAFTMYSTCIVWLAFVTIYFGANHDFKIEITSLCMCVNISATVALFCLFTPKIYIVLLQPHKNVRQTSAASLSASNKTSRTFYDAARSTAGIITSATAAVAATAGEPYAYNGGVYCGEITPQQFPPFQAAKDRKKSGSHVITSFTTVATEEAPRESSFNEDDFDTIDDHKEDNNDGEEKGTLSTKADGAKNNADDDNKDDNGDDNDDFDENEVWQKRKDFDSLNSYHDEEGGHFDAGKVGELNNCGSKAVVVHDEVNGVYNDSYTQKLREIMSLSKNLQTPPGYDFEEYEDSSCDETSPVKINRVDNV